MSLSENGLGKSNPLDRLRIQPIIYATLWYLSASGVTPIFTTASILHALGAFIGSTSYPSRIDAIRISMVIHFLGFAINAHVLWELGFMPFRGLDPTLGRMYLMALPCSSKSRMHYGPGQDRTLEVWITGGRWCKTAEQNRGKLAKEMRKHRAAIEHDRCLTSCIYRLADSEGMGSEDYAKSASDWHGYVTSAPAGELPGKDFCGVGYYLGNCPSEYLGKHHVDTAWHLKIGTVLHMN